MADQAIELNRASSLIALWRREVGILLAVASFLIYAAIALGLPQVRDNSFPCERSSIAAAVSNILYGARVGTVQSGLLEQYLESLDMPLEKLLHGTPGLGNDHPTPPPGYLMKTTKDGNGVGYVIVTTVAFHLFGLHASSLLFTMLMLMALSAGLFLWRFAGVLAAVVTLYFTALTVMLFTPLITTPAYAINIPVAGIRYYSLLAVLPAFHILLDILDKPAEPRAAGKQQHIMLGIQAAILTIALMVRGSMSAVIVVILSVGLLLARRHRSDNAWIPSLRRKAAIMGLTMIALVAAIALAVPDNYLKEGRFGTVLWHRVTMSLGIDPAFPYPGVREMFPCETYIPEGIQPGVPDRNGHCMWIAYVIEHNISVYTIAAQIYGSRYETALRDAFFRIAVRYPFQVLKTFMIIKPQYIISSIAESLVFDVRSYSPQAIGLLIAALMIFSVHVIVAAPPLVQLPRIGGVAILCAACSLPPLIAVWAFPDTSGDLLLFCLLLVGLALGLIPEGIRAALRHVQSAPAAG